MGEVVNLGIDVEGVETAVAVGEAEVDDVRPLGAHDPRHFAKRARDVAEQAVYEMNAQVARQILKSLRPR